MGFKKTEKGNVIYEFDFTPTKLVPMSVEETGGPHDIYRVEGPNGERAPIAFEYQGERYANYGFVFCSPTDESVKGVACITTNVQLVSTLAKMLERSATDNDFDPWACDNMARNGMSFAIDSLDEAQRYIRSKGIPRDDFELLKSVI